MKPLNILLIDDDKDDQFFFVEALRSIGSSITCNVADDGLKGLSALEESPAPDLIFVDLNMPQMNGFDFLRTVKENDRLKHIPVIIFTTSNHHHDIQKARELKAIAFLTKPNNLNELSQRISYALQLDHAGDHNDIYVIS